MANPEYIDNAAYAIEQSVGADWRNILSRHNPLLGMVLGRQKNFMGSANVQGDGTFLLPIITANTGAEFEGVSRSNQLVPLDFVLQEGPTQAKYTIAHFRGGYVITDEEAKYLSGTAGTYRGNVLKAKKSQFSDKVKKVLAPLVAGSQADSQTQPLGVLRALATANTVGGINQATVSDWQSNVDSAGGTLSFDRVDDMIRAAHNREGMVDLMVLSEASGGANLFNAFKALIRGQGVEPMVDNNSLLAKFGFKGFMYSGIECVGDIYLAAGNVIGLSTEHWAVVGDEKPRMHAPTRKEGTDAYEVFATQYLGLGTNHPGGNFRLSGLTS